MKKSWLITGCHWRGWWSLLWPLVPTVAGHHLQHIAGPWRPIYTGTAPRWKIIGISHRAIVARGTSNYPLMNQVLSCTWTRQSSVGPSCWHVKYWCDWCTKFPLYANRMVAILRGTWFCSSTVGLPLNQAFPAFWNCQTKHIQWTMCRMVFFDRMMACSDVNIDASY